MIWIAIDHHSVQDIVLWIDLLGGISSLSRGLIVMSQAERSLGFSRAKEVGSKGTTVDPSDVKFLRQEVASRIVKVLELQHRQQLKPLKRQRQEL